MTSFTDTSPRETVARLYEAFEAGDTAAAFACFDPEIVISQSAELPWGGTYRGLEEAAAFFTRLTSRIRTQVKVERFVLAGDTVVESGRTEGIALESGREFSIPETHVFKVRDGKIVRMEAYVENAEMLDALVRTEGRSRAWS